VFNYDESRVVLRFGRLTTQRVEARGKDRSNAPITRNKTVALLLTINSANRTVFFSVYVLKGTYNEEESTNVSSALEKAPPARRRECPRFFCWTETGYLNADTFGNGMGLFAEEWGVRNPGREALLFGDQLGSQKKVETIESALLKGVFLFLIAANSSHINQPLDEVPSASYKKWSVGDLEQATFESMVTGTLARDLLLGAVFTAERRVFTPDNIQGTFRRCALWPFNPVAMTRRCGEATGILAHSGILHEEATVAASEVIRASAERTSAAAARPSKGKATMRHNILHSPVDLLAQHAA